MDDIGLLLVVQMCSGLTRAMVLFLVASGLSLVFGILNVMNFAHGSFYMLGAFFSYWFFTKLQGMAFGFGASLFLAALAVGVVGLVIEVFLLRRTYSRGHTPQLLLTFAMTMVISDLVRMIWGGQFYSIQPPQCLSGPINLGAMTIPSYNLFIICLGVGIFVGLWLLIYRTKLGKIIRAAVYDREVVSFLGVPIPWLFSLVFVMGLAIAGLAGGVYAPLVTIDIGMDVSMLIEAFAVVIIGGVGSLPGTLIGALVVGLIHSFGIILVPKMTIAMTYFVMAVVLIVRPYGLLGKRQ